MKKVIQRLFVLSSLFAIAFTSCKKDDDKDPFEFIYGEWSYVYSGIYNFNDGSTVEEWDADWGNVTITKEGNFIDSDDETYQFKTVEQPQYLKLWWGDFYKAVKRGNNEIVLLATPETVDNYYDNPNHVWGYVLRKR